MEDKHMSNYEVYPVGKIKHAQDGTFIEIEERYLPALKELNGFSHINVIWWFSEFDNKEMRNTFEVTKPYKKSPETMGIFATRSPIRPNPSALTAVEVISIDAQKGRILIAFIDANDDTPVLDIKPYTPSLDRIESPKVPDWCQQWPKSSEESASFAWEEEFNF
jgi:tRNA-Thr(GGU) m(6)t(6)A37 methyltransferase TsaA